MEEILNTESKNTVDFSNIRNIQNLLKSNEISNLNSSVKSFKQRINVLGAKISEIKSSIPAAGKAEPTLKPETVAEKKPEVKVQVAAQSPAQKPQQFKPNAPRQEGSRPPFNPQRNGQNFGNGFQGQRQGSGFQGQRQNGFSSRPQGRFTPTGERRFDTQTDKKPGGYTAGVGGFKGGVRPIGQAGGF